mmetsp:Transcript_20393/g.44438  ORF Transcript_20393/g.44438 Transcript_20393/m.44438 type:complete len:163 (-) Transcript_20393:66-554(-)
MLGNFVLLYLLVGAADAVGLTDCGATGACAASSSPFQAGPGIRRAAPKAMMMEEEDGPEIEVKHAALLQAGIRRSALPRRLLEEDSDDVMGSATANALLQDGMSRFQQVSLTEHLEAEEPEAPHVEDPDDVLGEAMPIVGHTLLQVTQKGGKVVLPLTDDED